jgi:cephalosporin hydroxylase
LYNSKFPETKWFGIEILKNPLDMWIAQEMIYEIKPDVLIETGTFKSGSAIFYCHLMDLMNHGKVITIDIEFRENRPVHKRLRHILGSSVDAGVLNEVRKACAEAKTVLVFLDSDHSKEHVFNEIMAYKDFVTQGSYMVVEDTALHGNPIHPGEWEDPMGAVEEFMKTPNGFIQDRSKEKFLMTWHPKGFLKKL